MIFKVDIKDANTPVSLDKTVTELTLPKGEDWDNGNDAGVKITWVSSNTKAIALNAHASNTDNAKMNVVHGKEKANVTLSLTITKGSASKSVKVATFEVEKD